MEAELIPQRMPYSVEAEQAVLGAMLIDPRCVPEVIELLRADDFYLAENKSIFEVIFGMFSFGKPIDPIVVLDQLKQQGVYDSAGGQAYLAQILEITPTAANMRAYAAIVKEKSLLRRLAGITGETYRRVMEGEADSSALLENTEQKIYELRYRQSEGGLQPVKSVLFSAYTGLNELAKNGGHLPGVSSGFAHLDRVLTGFNNSDLILIAARPGVGKTSFAMNLAYNAAARSGKKVAVFNLEMSSEQLVLRLLSSQAMIDFKRLRTAELNDEEWQKLARTTAAVGETQMYIDDTSNITPADIKAKCRRLGDNLGLVVIDYLQLLHSGKKIDNRVLEVGDISRSLKIMAKELNVPVICLSQLSRAVESRAEKKPQLSDLRDSGAIEQDADIVMFLYREDYNNPNAAEHNTCECMIAKNRHGETTSVKFQWIGQYFLFSTPETRLGEGG